MTRPALITRIAGAAALVTTGALIAALAWLDSQSGLEWATRQLVNAGDGTIEIQGVEGSLLREVRIARLAVTADNRMTEAETLTLAWRPLALLGGELRLSRAAAAMVRYRDNPTTASQPPDTLALPFDITITELAIGRLEVAGLPAIDNLRLAYSGGRISHQISLQRTQIADWTIDATLQVAAQAPFALNGKTLLRRGSGESAVQVKAGISGTIEGLDIDAAGSNQGAAIKATATLRPYAALPVGKLTLHAQDLDLAAWASELPRTRISVEATAQSANTTLTGTVRITNGMPGALDAGRLPLDTAKARFTGNGMQWVVQELELQLPGGGRTAGSASLQDGKGSVDMQLRDIDPARIHRGLQPGKVSGHLTLSGNVQSQQASLRLDSKGLTLHVVARHDGRALTVDSARLQAGTGTAELSGQVGTRGQHAFKLAGRLNRLDLSRIAAMPPVVVNGRIGAHGVLHPDWQAQVQIALADSRLRGVPFSVLAEFKTGSTRLFEGTARAAVANNRFDITGQYGRAQDRLTWSLSAENLRALDPALAGRINGRGSVAGTAEQLALDFSIDGQQLAAGRHRAARLEARGTLTAGRDSPVEFTANATGVQLADTRFDTLQLAGNGTRLRHVLQGSARGPEATASLRATGSLDARQRWVGSLDQLEMTRPWPLRLAAPAQISAGRDLLIIEQLRGSLLGGDFGPVSLRVESGRINTQGTFRGIAAGPLLPRNSGIEAADLRLGGEWSLRLDDAWTGNASIHRESGDLALAGTPPLPLGLRKAMLKLAAVDSVIDATLDADSTAMGTATARLQTRMIRHQGRWLLPGDAPVTGSADMDFRSLAWLRAALPGVDQVAGQLAVRLRVDGTIATPRATGTISGDQLMVRAIGQGVDLREGRLRATLDGSHFRLDEFELKAGKGRITAQGTAALAGGLQNVDMQVRAEHAQILLAPQWSAIIDGSGRLGFSDRNIRIEGKFILDEGRYDPGTATRPTLDDDVIVRSRQAKPAVKSAPLPLHLDVSLDLNDKLTVRGRGLDALLGGGLRVTNRNGALSAIGDVRTVRGKYLAFGQQLDIERGTVIFNGPLTDPGLDLRAIRKFQSVEVGVEVTGSLQRPLAKLVSNPDMSDTDRLGWLTLGRDPQGTDRAQLALLQAAVLGMTSGGKPMQRQFAEGVGLDEIGFTSGENGALGAVALGKKLTDKLSLRLEQTLGGTAGTLLRMDFIMSEKWRLRGTAGSENAGDILFTLRFD